jgi:hypothetical protein
MSVVLLEDTEKKCFNIVYEMVIKYNIRIKFRYLSYVKSYIYFILFGWYVGFFIYVVVS